MAAKYTALETIFTALSTELNSLADASVCSASSAFDNDSSGQRFPSAMLEIYIAAQAAIRNQYGFVSVFLVPTTDGTNYGNATAECLDNYLVGSYVLDSATTARYITAQIVLPPTDYKILLRNNTGQALASSGNTVKIRKFTAEDV